MGKDKNQEVTSAQRAVRTAEKRIAECEADLRMWKRLLEVRKKELVEAEAGAAEAAKSP